MSFCCLKALTNLDMNERNGIHLRQMQAPYSTKDYKKSCILDVSDFPDSIGCYAHMTEKRKIVIRFQINIVFNGEKFDKCRQLAVTILRRLRFLKSATMPTATDAIYCKYIYFKNRSRGSSSHRFIKF